MPYLRLFCSGILLSGTGVATGQTSGLTEARQWISEWVQARQLISRTEADWQQDREMLEQTRLLYERDLEAVRDQMGQLGTTSSEVDREREQTEARVAAAQQALDTLRTQVGAMERGVRTLLPQLPPPLIQILQPLVARLPENPDGNRPSVPERYQTVVGILNEIEKFHAAIHVVGDRKPNTEGEQVAVDVLYIGLAAAFYVDTSGEVAGRGVPGAAGWKWEPTPKLSGRIRETIAVYRNQKPAVFVGLPITLEADAPTQSAAQSAALSRSVTSQPIP